jgi:hypothetical protein
MDAVEQHAEHALEGVVLMAGETAVAGFSGYREQRSVVIEHAFYRPESSGSTDGHAADAPGSGVGRLSDWGRGER